MSSKTNFLKKSFLIILIILILLFLGLIYLSNLSFSWFVIETYNIITWTSFWIILFLLLYLVRPLIMLPAVVLSILSGMLYGQEWWIWIHIAFFIALVGSLISASFAYFLARTYGSKIIPNTQKKNLSGFKSKIQENSFRWVLLLRFSLSPFDITSYAAWVLGVRFSGFFFWSLIGNIPVIYTMVLIGSSINIVELVAIIEGEKNLDINIELLVLWITIFVIIYFLSKLIAWWSNSSK